MPNICLFCGSRPGHSAAHAGVAERFGEAVAAAGYGLVYGGGAVGMMGIAARACLAAGGRVTGVIPRFLVEAEVALHDVSELVVVETLHERKAEMARLSHAFVALPGGIGTLDELFEIMTWRELGLHDRPIFALGPDSYWSPLFTLLHHISERGFAPPHLAELLEPVDSPEALFAKLGG